MAITENNYKIALELQKERFNNRRAIINSCLNAFLFQKPIIPLNKNSLRSLIDNTKETLQCIESLDVQVDHWSPIVVFIVQTKMDIETKCEWETHLGGGTRVPLYEDVINFLEMRHRILENIPPPIVNSLPQKSNNFQAKSETTEQKINHVNFSKKGYVSSLQR